LGKNILITFFTTTAATTATATTTATTTATKSQTNKILFTTKLRVCTENKHKFLSNNFQ